MLRLKLATGSNAEEDVARRLVDLVQRYELARWTFTDEVVVAEGATPHSHPVLTLGTGYPHDTALLCSYLHEQLHWWAATCPGATADHGGRVVDALRTRYAPLPLEPPAGCGSERSNLVHLHVCWLEIEALAQLFGSEWAEKRARRVPFYRSIYRAVVEDREELRDLFVAAGMGLPSAERAPDRHRPPEGPARPAGRPERAARAASLRRVPPALADLPLVARGKVREMYDLGDRLLMVASDRISTYDVVHPTPIPDKGKVLTGLSVFWFEQSAEIVPNHLLSATDGVLDEVRGRALSVRKLEMLPVECVVRGYLSGSGWKDYQATGAVAGIELPDGLLESQQLPEPIFTPSTKADVGHDETIDFDRAAEIVGDRELMAQLRDLSIALYSFAAEHAFLRGVMLADTKFEFGIDAEGVLRVGDEVLTPDSSRFWPADSYEAGRPQPSFDKQYVRDWAAGTGWDKKPPAPPIPDDVVAGTRQRYVEAYERITGEPFDAWLERVAP